ncbi:MAG: 3-dehydroquinate synthase [Candidatus Diapherotrites archaeon]|nr:3-dehydroquinate synthase [Candidatus Diapherotrites archaeon]
MKKLKFSVKRSPKEEFEVYVGRNIFPEVAQILGREKFANKYAIICDLNVEALFGDKLLSELKKENLNAELISFPAGEENKNLKTVEGILDELLEKGFDRKSAVIALGGGISTDIAGFVASIFMRGIPYVSVPTTLTSVDSAIGGKTGVDLAEGKNLAGTFWQPKKVFYDSWILKTLPGYEMRNGLPEIIKHGLIFDKDLLCFIESINDDLYTYDEEKIDELCSDMEELILKNVEVKAKIICEDERESELRKALNYGHTLGHAIESLSNYSIPHGIAVIKGMNFAGKLSVELGYMKKEEFNSQKIYFQLLGYFHDLELPKFSVDQYIAKMMRDKKSKDGKMQFVLLEKIGKIKTISGKVGIEVEEKIVRKVLKEMLTK